MDIREASTSRGAPKANIDESTQLVSNPAISVASQWDHEKIILGNSFSPDSETNDEVNEDASNAESDRSTIENQTFSFLDSIEEYLIESRLELKTPEIEDLVRKYVVDKEPIPDLKGQLDECLQTETEGIHQEPNNLQEVVPSTDNEEPNTQPVDDSFTAVIRGNTVYKVVLNETPDLIPVVKICNHQVTAGTTVESLFDKDNFQKLATPKIFRYARQELCQIHTKYNTNLDANKAIIKTFGKRGYDILFQDEEERLSAEDCNKDKVFLLSGLLAWMISKPANLTIDEFKKFMERAAQNYTTGLDEQQWDYFENNILVQYSHERMNNDSGVQSQREKRRAENIDESTNTKRRSV